MGLPHDQLPVLEQFVSIQGEGVNLGMPYYFIRVGGCPLRCTHCDSEYTWKMKTDSILYVDEVVNHAIEACKMHNIEWISITGGEPLLYPFQLKKMMERFHRHGLKTHIETSGRFWDHGVHTMCDIYSADAKTPCTNETMHGYFMGMEQLRPQDQIKCLIDNIDDLRFANEVNIKLDGKCTMVLQPFNQIPKHDDAFDVVVHLVLKFKELLQLFHKVCEHGMVWKNVILTPQVHVLAYGNKPGV